MYGYPTGTLTPNVYNVAHSDVKLNLYEAHRGAREVWGRADSAKRRRWRKASWLGLLSAFWFRPVVLSLEPSFCGTGEAVEAGNVRFDIDNRRQIKGIYAAHAQHRLFSCEQADDGHTYAVWPAGMAGREYSMRRVVEKGGTNQAY